MTRAWECDCDTFFRGIQCEIPGKILLWSLLGCFKWNKNEGRFLFSATRKITLIGNAKYIQFKDLAWLYSPHDETTLWFMQSLLISKDILFVFVFRMSDVWCLPGPFLSALPHGSLWLGTTSEWRWFGVYRQRSGLLYDSNYVYYCKFCCQFTYQNDCFRFLILPWLSHCRSCADHPLVECVSNYTSLGCPLQASSVTSSWICSPRLYPFVLWTFPITEPDFYSKLFVNNINWPDYCWNMDLIKKSSGLHLKILCRNRAENIHIILVFFQFLSFSTGARILSITSGTVSFVGSGFGLAQALLQTALTFGRSCQG